MTPIMNKIKNALQTRHLSQKWLAEKLKVTTVSVNSWCQNRSQPSIPKLFKVAELLEIKPSHLLKD
jgi:putative transcriptional regulator